MLFTARVRSPTDLSWPQSLPSSFLKGPFTLPLSHRRFFLLLPILRESSLQLGIPFYLPLCLPLQPSSLFRMFDHFSLALCFPPPFFCSFPVSVFQLGFQWLARIQQNIFCLCVQYFCTLVSWSCRDLLSWVWPPSSRLHFGVPSLRHQVSPLESFFWGLPPSGVMGTTLKPHF